MTDSSASCAAEDGEKQHLFVIRHGDRWDYAYPEVRSFVVVDDCFMSVCMDLTLVIYCLCVS